MQDERGNIVRRERIEGNRVEGFRLYLRGEPARAVMEASWNWSKKGPGDYIESCLKRLSGDNRIDRIMYQVDDFHSFRQLMHEPIDGPDHEIGPNPEWEC